MIALLPLSLLYVYISAQLLLNWDSSATYTGSHSPKWFKWTACVFWPVTYLTILLILLKDQLTK